MQDYKKQFIELAIRHQVLRFGEFTLKSGRVSPYFFNAGLFNTGAAMALVADSYAAALQEHAVAYDMIFGPAYKGIPLAAGIAVVLATEYGQDKPYAFNRKETKDHGEGGNIVGAALRGDVLIVDDVITAGTAIREAVDIIEAQGARPHAVLIALDRQEKGQGELSAIQEVRRDYGIEVYSIITLQDLIDYLAEDARNRDILRSMRDYRERYGVQPADVADTIQ